MSGTCNPIEFLFNGIYRFVPKENYKNMQQTLKCKIHFSNDSANCCFAYNLCCMGNFHWQKSVEQCTKFVFNSVHARGDGYCRLKAVGYC